MTLVRITGARRRYQPISFVKAVREVTGEGLATSKDKLDRVVAGETIAIELADDLAASFVSGMEQMGFFAHSGE